jgi:hypothetical protein
MRRDLLFKISEVRKIYSMEIKQCPFCGGVPKFKSAIINCSGNYHDLLFLECECGIKTENKSYGNDRSIDDAKKLLLKIWNNRI